MSNTGLLGNAGPVTYQDVLHFWFEELSPQDWWSVNEQADQTILERYGAIHQEACSSGLISWRTSPEGCLAEIIILDQFSRNIHRNTPAAFANDDLSVELARAAIEQGSDSKLPSHMRPFVYLPYMHSESSEDHTRAVELFSQAGMTSNLEFEMKHKRIIDRFGRYPHRNSVLGRDSTAEELEFLKEPDSSF